MYQITALSHTAQALLNAPGQGLVHSVYDKTVNLLCGGTLLSLQAQGTAASPLTLETSCTAGELRALGLRPGMAVRFLPGGVYVGELYFDAHRAARWDAELAHFLPPAPSAGPEFLSACLRGILPRGGFACLVLPEEGLAPSPYAAEAGDLLRSVRPALAAHDWPLAAQRLCALVGLGEGLTPSGDDFLCGVLAACRLSDAPGASELRSALCAALPSCLDKTNLISAGFLRCAIDGLFSRPVLALAQGVSLPAAQAAFAAIGHSSGADTLSGMLFLLSAL